MTMQSLYQHTSDGSYIMPLPNGQVMSVNTRSEGSHVQDRFRWNREFEKPMYVLMTSSACTVT
jgi:hypothetical protein